MSIPKYSDIVRSYYVLLYEISAMMMFQNENSIIFLLMFKATFQSPSSFFPRLISEVENMLFCVFEKDAFRTDGRMNCLIDGPSDRWTN